MRERNNLPKESAIPLKSKLRAAKPKVRQFLLEIARRIAGRSSVLTALPTFTELVLGRDNAITSQKSSSVINPPTINLDFVRIA